MTKKILLADPSVDAVREITRALRQKGHQVYFAQDGSRALEQAVLRHPDLILFDDRCELLDARTFMGILHSNPRTEDIPVVLAAATAVDERYRHLPDGYVKKPYDLDETLAHVDHVFRRREAARALRGDAREIEGNLAQVTLPDLLQLLAMNRRTGRVALSRGNENGEIHLNEGRPANARLGQTEGEKALFRLIGWKEGAFAFTPGPPVARVRITHAMDAALLEGMRQSDEVARLLTSLPARNDRLRVDPSFVISTEDHPAAAEIVQLLHQPRTVSEAMDLASENDLAVATALVSLMERGVATVVESDQSALGEGPILGPGELHALRARITRSRSSARPPISKVFLCATSAAARTWLSRLQGLAAVSAQPAALRSGFGTLARLDLGEGVLIDFCMLPGPEAARPLLHPFSAAALGAVLLDEDPSSVPVAAYLALQRRLPLVVVNMPIPMALLRAPAGIARSDLDSPDGLRALLLLALTPPTPSYTGF